MKIYPSVFAFLTLNIGDEIIRFDNISSGLHVDIIDGSYIKNFGFPIYMAKMLRSYTQKPIHIHVMGFIDNLIDEIIECQPDVVFFHVDSTQNPQAIIGKLLNNRIEPAIAVSYNKTDNKETIMQYYRKIFDLYKQNNLQYLLLMTVNPGKCGQKFIESKKQELLQLNELFIDAKIIIDGGVNREILHDEIVKSNTYGAVVGSALYKNDFCIDKIRLILS